MIQRRQTLFLILIVALLLPLFFLPFASFVVNGEEFEICARGLRNMQTGEMIPAWAMYAFLNLSLFTPLVTIFLFKKRKIQIYFCLAEIIFLAGLCGFVAYYVIGCKKLITQEEVNAMACSFTCIIPVLAFLLNLFAYKRIVHDELLIKSLDRIR